MLEKFGTNIAVKLNNKNQINQSKIITSMIIN